MPFLAKPYEAYERPGLVVSYKITNTKIYKGGFLAVASSGYVQTLNAATASLKFVGIAKETVDNSTGNAGDKQIASNKTGAFVFKAASGYTPAITDIGKEVYAASDWEVQTSSTGLTNPYKVGTIVAIENTSTGDLGVRVRIDNYTV